MRAVVCKELTGVDGLTLEDNWPEPVAGPGEVLIDVKAAALNFPDLLMIKGLYQEQPPLPFIPGSEFAGTVAAVGKSVSRLKPGDRVVSVSGSALAEKTAVRAELVLPAPATLDFTSASGICITYFTTLHAFKQRALLQAGETLLVLGAAGGVGATAVELGKLMGARVIAAASNEEKLELARSLGADETINYTTEDLRARVKEITSGKGVDVVYDPVGAQLAEPALRSLAWKGRYLVIGFAGGEIPRVPLNLPLLKGSSIVGVFWGDFARREPKQQLANALELWKLFDEGKLRPLVGEIHELADYESAFESLAGRRARGKVVIRI
jgi:NADPH2:quinone reductase